MLYRYCQVEFRGDLKKLTEETKIHHSPTKEQVEKVVSEGGYYKFCEYNQCWAFHFNVIGSIDENGAMIPLPNQRIKYPSMRIKEAQDRINRDISKGIRCPECFKIEEIGEDKCKS